MLAELTFQHASYLVQDVRMADICLASPFYLPCLRYHVLRAYCKFASKQAISITLFGARPNNKRCNISSVITPKKISYGSPRKWMSNFTKLHLTHEIFRILPVFSQFLWNLTFIFSDSHEKFSLVLLQMTIYIFRP